MARSLRVEIVGDASKLRQVFGQVESDTDTFGKRLEGKLGGAAKIAGAGLLAVGAGAAAAAAGAYKLGDTFDSAYDTIRLNTGATGDALAGLQDDFRAVVKNVPTDFDTASQAIAGLNQRLGLTGQPLQDVASRSIELARLTGGDLATQIAATTRVMGDWGIAAENQGASLDAMFRASQATGIGVDQLSESLVKFGAPLRQLGFSFDESTAMIAKFEKEGVNADLVMGAMRKSLGTMAKEGEAPVETFRRVSDEIRNAGTQADANRIAVEMFGAKAGPDMAAAIREGRFELGELLTTVSSGGETIMGAAEDTTDFAESWQTFKNNVLLALEPIATRVFNALGQGMAALIPVIQDISERYGPAIGEMFNRIGELVTPLIDRFSGEGGLSPTIERVVALVGEKFTELQPIFLQIQGVIMSALDAIMAGWDLFGHHIVTYFQTYWDNIVLVLKGALNIIQGVFEFFAGLFTGDWDRMWAGLGQIFYGAWQVIEGTLRQALNIMQTVMDIALAILANIWRGIWSGISSFFHNIWEGIKGKTAEAIGNVRTTISNVTGAISNAWSTVWGGIRDFLGGVWDGIKGAASAAMGALQGIVRGAVDEIGRIWGNLRALFTDPLRFVADSVNTWAGTVEAVADRLGLKIDIPAVRFHSGGVVGEDRGTRGPGRVRPGERFAVLQDGEGVLQRGAMTRIGRDNFYKLNQGEVDFLEPETGGPYDFVKNAVFEAIDAARRLIAETARPAVEAAVRAMEGAGARFGPVGRIAGGGGRRAAQAALDWLRGVEAEADKVGMGTLPGTGAGWQRLAAYIQSTNVPHRITSTVRPGSITASGNKSRHSMGLAIDVAGPTAGNDSPQLGRIFHAFLPIEKQLNELIYAGPQTSFNIKRGARVGKYAQAQHHDHVHAALADGGNVVRAGRFLVGEHGPEVVGLPRGTRVAPLADSGPSVNVRTLNVNLQGVFDLTDPAEQRRLAMRLRELLRRLDREVA